MQKLIEFLNHQRFQAIATVVCIFLVLYGVSCESQVPSMYDKTEKVTRAELTTEIEMFIARADHKFKALDQQDQLKTVLFDNLALWSQTGTFNPAGILPILFSIFGIGAVTDNVRLRKKAKANNVTYDKSTRPTEPENL